MPAAATLSSAGGVGQTTAGATPMLPPQLEHGWLLVERRHRVDAVRKAIHALGSQRALVFMNFAPRLKARLICLERLIACLTVIRNCHILHLAREESAITRLVARLAMLSPNVERFKYWAGQMKICAYFIARCLRRMSRWGSCGCSLQDTQFKLEACPGP